MHEIIGQGSIVVSVFLLAGCVGDSTLPDASVDATTGDVVTDTTTDSPNPNDAATDVAQNDAGTDAAQDAASFHCGLVTCTLGSEGCCFKNTGTCDFNDGGDPCSYGTSWLRCSQTSQCGTNQVCCASQSNLSVGDSGPQGYFSTCTASTSCVSGQFQSAFILCSGPNDKSCPGNQTCSPVTDTTRLPQAWYYCK